jgi:hypothetical protein
MFKLFTQNNSLPVRQRKTQLNQLLDVIFITKRTILILHHMKSCGAKCIHFQTKPSEQVRLAIFSNVGTSMQLFFGYFYIFVWQLMGGRSK